IGNGAAERLPNVPDARLRSLSVPEYGGKFQPAAIPVAVLFGEDDLIAVGNRRGFRGAVIRPAAFRVRILWLRGRWFRLGGHRTASPFPGGRESTAIANRVSQKCGAIR